MLTDEKPGPYDMLRRELALALWDVGSVLTLDMSHPLVVQRGEERGFLVAEHAGNSAVPLCPYAFNLRTKDDPQRGLLTQEVLTLAVRCMYETAKRQKLTYEAIAAVPRAGVPFAQTYHRDHARFPIIQLEREEGPDGTAGHIRVFGGSRRAKSVLLIDDMITYAEPKLEAIDALENWSYNAANTLVLIDCEQGGAVQLAGKGYALWAVFSVTELFRFYVAQKLATGGLLDAIHGYRSRVTR